VAAPWFGPNVWTALLQPTSGGGIPIPPAGVVEVKLTFKDGGAFDFHTRYERVRERLQQAVETQRMDGDGQGGAQRVDVGNVDLEELPVYVEEGEGPLIAPIAPTIQQNGRMGGDGVRERPRREEVPDEAPPGYEEAQMAGLQDELERREQR